MHIRDYNYIEARLFTPVTATEAIRRLKSVNEPDLANRLIKATLAYTDECSEIRRLLAEVRLNADFGKS
jgi:hypothetical protein